MAALPTHRPALLLELDLTEVPVSPEAADPLDRLRNRGRRQLRPTLRALYEAGADRRVVGLIAKVGGPLPWATMQELRQGVRAFADSGKPTVAWAESFDGASANLSAYALASARSAAALAVGPLGVGWSPLSCAGAGQSRISRSWSSGMSTRTRRTGCSAPSSPPPTVSLSSGYRSISPRR